MTIKYYHTKESVDEYIKMADGIDGSELIEILKKHLKPGSKVLELGSGPGSDWEILNKDFNVVGSDLSDEFLERLRKKYPKGEFININAVDINTDQNFDCIYSNKVLIHLNDKELKSSITSQHEVLNDDGLICHSFWKGEETETHKGLLVNNQTLDSIKKIFCDKFEVLDLEEYKEFEDKDSILLIMRKK